MRMHHRRSLALGLVSLLWLLSVRAMELGEPYFETVGDSRSIPDNNVGALAEDRAGFLWVGTPAGLFRYDGYRFVRFAGDATNGSGLGGGFIRALLVARDGRLWIGTDADGLWIYNPADGRTEHFRQNTEDAGSLAYDNVRAFAEDQFGGMWIGTRGGLDYRAPGAASFEHHRQRAGDTRSLNADRIEALWVDRHGDLWVGSPKGLNRRRFGAKEFESVLSDPRRAGPLAAQTVLSLLEAADGRIWVATGEGAGYILDPVTLQWVEFEHGKGATDRFSGVARLTQTLPDEVWMASFGGIDILDAHTGHVRRHILYEPGARYGLAGNDLRALLLDRSGQLWIGSYGGGLQRIEPRRSGVSILRYGPTQKKALSWPSVVSVLELNNGELWIGTQGNGIDILDRREGLIGGLRLGADRAKNLPHGFVRALTQSRDGSVWLGAGTALLRIDTRTRTLREYGPQKGYESADVRCLFESHDGALWIGTRSGLKRWSSQNDRIERVDDEDGAPLRDDINALVEDAEGRLWVGSVLGLYTLSPGAGRVARVRVRSGSSHELAHPSVVGLLFDRRGRLWVDTSLGLNQMLRFDGEFAEFESVSSRLGIGGRPFGANLLEDAAGRIWTQQHVFDPQLDSLYVLTHADGIDIGTPWYRAYTQTRDGLLLFGGSTGLLVIDPARFQPWTYAPPVVLTGWMIDGVQQRSADISHGLTLQAGQRGFGVEFSALDFTEPDRNRYGYRLLGYDPDWINTDAGRRVASYTNLWPGNYTLNVRGSNRNRDWSPHEFSVSVRVMPAYWQTPWFAGLVLVAAWAGAYGGFRWRTARLRRRSRELKELVEQRTAELQASHGRLEVSKSEIESAHARLTTTHTELASTHARLLDAQQRLVLHEKMAALGTLTAGVAHEINNPTNFIAGSAQNLEVQMRQFGEFLRQLAGADADPEVLNAFDQQLQPQQEQLANILDGAKRIRAIVLDLRQFTRLDEAEHKSIAVAEPIQSTVNLVCARFDRIRIVLGLDFNPIIECQPAKLGQVFMNLIVNACEAIEHCDDRRAGAVSITTSRAASDVVEIDVADNGCGMDAAVRERVFEPFFTTKSVGAGTGLGLAVVFGIVKDHGGSIEVESVPGIGSHFRLCLPLRQSA